MTFVLAVWLIHLDHLCLHSPGDEEQDEAWYRVSLVQDIVAQQVE